MKIRIIGCGNPLAGDDGLGIYAARKLAEMKLPEGVEVVEAGTPGLGLLSFLENADAVIIVDALKRGSPPGTLHRVEAREIIKEGKPLSAHDLGVEEALTLGFRLLPEKMPKKILIVGVEAGRVESFREGLTQEVEKALPKLLELILREVERLLEGENGGPEGI
ncbi:hydrogenase [Candidatus Bathyarchaeota archaeon]|nr:MAG: hydrogenase [Candidatus Bathyarchaeota archaeon]